MLDQEFSTKNFKVSIILFCKSQIDIRTYNLKFEKSHVYLFYALFLSFCKYIVIKRFQVRDQKFCSNAICDVKQKITY